VKTGAFALLIAVVGVLATAAHGTERTLTFGFKASLDARQQIPKQAVPTPLARGTLSGALVVTGSSGRLTWRLTLADLSGAARRADIHLAKLERRGPAAVTLCHPCRSGTHGTARMTTKVVEAIRKGGAYVEVETKKNPSGEIRGQLRVLTGA
jgi:CHRD domain-containing protein